MAPEHVILAALGCNRRAGRVNHLLCNRAEDAKRYGVPAPTMEALGAPLVHTVELSAPRVLHPGESLDTPTLHIATQVVKAQAQDGSGQGFRFEHFILTLANKSTHPVAYRVDTGVESPEKCRSQGTIAHNAIALLPGEKIRRTECLYHPGMAVTIKSAETIELGDLGYYYVSRLVPSQIGLDARTAQGHLNPAGSESCKFVPWREIEVGGASWADVIDFYARHSCDAYAFFRTYRYRTAPGPLPAQSGVGNPPAPTGAPPPP